MDRLRKRAKADLDTGLASIRRWWVNKYKLPASHDLFQKQALADHQRELMEDLWRKREELMDDLASPNTRNAESIHVALDAIDRALGLKKADDAQVITGDPLVDFWERELAAGRMPDLEMTDV